MHVCGIALNSAHTHTHTHSKSDLSSSDELRSDEFWSQNALLHHHGAVILHTEHTSICAWKHVCMYAHERRHQLHHLYCSLPPCRLGPFHHPLHHPPLLLPSTMPTRPIPPSIAPPLLLPSTVPTRPIPPSIAPPLLLPSTMPTRPIPPSIAPPLLLPSTMPTWLAYTLLHIQALKSEHSLLCCGTFWAPLASRSCCVRFYTFRDCKR